MFAQGDRASRRGISLRSERPATLKGAAYLVGLAVALVAGSAAGENSEHRLVLEPDLAIERPLGAGGADLFHAELAAGRHWLIQVEQLGVDVTVQVIDPQGRALLTVDSPLEREGAESLLLTPEIGGSHRVEVRCDQQGAPDGRYRIRLDVLAAVTAVDQLRLRAEAAVTDAGRLYAGQEDGAEQQAMARLEEALDAWRTLGDRSRQARALFLIGRILDGLDDRRRAVASYGRALALWRQQDNPGAVAATLDRLGLAHKSLGDNPQALAYLEQALILRRDLGQREREARTRNHLCLVLMKLGRFRAAGECHEKTLVLARELGDTALEARLLNNLGGVYQNLGEPAKALDFFQRALELRRAIGAELAEAITLNNLGFHHSSLGEVEEGLLHYGRSLAVFERLEDRFWQARTLNAIGFAYLTLGEPKRAQAYLLRSLPLRRQVGDRSGEAATLRNLGRSYSDQGAAGKATAFYRKALEISLAAGNRRGAATARKLLGAAQARRDPAAARGELELALASLREMGNRPEEAEVLELLGGVRLGLGEPLAARALAAQALEIHRAVRHPAGEVAALTTLARAERRLGRPGAGRELLETALEALETMHGQLGDPSQKASFLASQRQVYELHVDSLMELHRRWPSQGHDLTALEASERARSRSLLALLEGAGAGLGPAVVPALAERLRSAERRFTAKTRRQLQVLSREHDGEQALAAEQELYAALTELDNVRAEIRRQNPRYAPLGLPQTLDADAVRDLLDDQTVLLEYLLGEDRSFLWWVTPASVTAYELPPRESVEELAGQVHRQIGAIHQRTGALREALDALGQMLLGPVAGRLQDQRLVVVADGGLHLVPFAALTLPRGRQPVLERHEVVYLPSASVLAAQRREPAMPGAAANKTVAIFADPIFDRRDPRLAGDWTEAGKGKPAGQLEATRQAALLELEELDRLPHTRREAAAIAALVPSDRRLVATGGDARRSRVLDDELSAYRILHFATHGFIHPRTPELSGLVLSRLDAAGGELDSFLGLHEVSNLELSAQLVVLSGCRTALGKQVRGEGLVGLTRGFMYAGVPRVVASLWQVRDEATAELMARFYRAMLVEDLAPAAALRAAQLALRHERRFRDPFYWAAFALQGDWR